MAAVAAAAPTTRIASMDAMRGIAVMGILVANLPAFALPQAAYFSPLAAGGTGWADRCVWFATFVLVEGKMRGLFTLLFGASMLLVIEGAEAKGESAAAVHYRRMAVLLLIGLAHLYLFWWGDILAHYALVGAIAFLFVRMPTTGLLAAALVLIGLQTVSDAMATLAYFGSAARDTPDRIATWNGFADAFGVPPAEALRREIAVARGGFLAAARHRWEHELSPLVALGLIGAQTLGAMLLGMAGYRSGFLTGGWERARYRRWALVCLGITVPFYVALACNTIAHGFAGPWVFVASILVAEPLRPVMVIGYAALFLLLLQPDGWRTRRLAAVGRAAFTNYLGTTLLMTFIFSGWGLGQFGQWSRAQLYLLVPLAWAAMLAWSTPWLARYRYGPMEWLWRSLARGAWQPMRGGAAGS